MKKPNKRKIINDPVFGFINIPNDFLYDIIQHPYFQRLHRIKQLGLSSFVYPGAQHTRMQHSLGAMHLMGEAISQLRQQGHEITPPEAEAVRACILLHDIGHGPFSHALEHSLVETVSHEEISLLMMQKLNDHLEGKLEMAMSIFKIDYPKKFLHQLVSGQLDMDRLDYLSRDSFFSGVSEGIIGAARIIKMLNVHDDKLVVDVKGIYSIEKFLVARRLMYWQVYLHKTVLCAEKMLQKILQRAKEIKAKAPSPFLNIFLEGGEKIEAGVQQWLFEFCQLDDHDMMGAIKYWQMHEDKILSLLCRLLVERKLLKVKLQAEPVEQNLVQQAMEDAANQLGISKKEAAWFVFTGEASNTTYNPKDERINILFKDGTIKDISQVDNALIQQNLKDTVKKYYFCCLKS